MHESLLKFKPYVEKGLVRQVISPCGKLVLWNYTDKCTYEKAWDEVTLNARGTVYEIETGEVVAKAFPKFFNFGELSTEKQQEVLNAKNFEVFEKMDGSLGIVYFYDGEWRVNTRGSFTSDQAIKGKEMLDEKYNIPDTFKGCTFLVEIIYPENKIIVDYGNVEKLTLLSSYGKRHLELPYGYKDDIGFDVVPSYKFNSIQDLINHLKTLDHTEEGYVVKLEDGYRVKFKSEEYLRLARILSRMSPLAFWKKMDNGKIDREFLEQLPEEFRKEADSIAEKLEEQYSFQKETHLFHFRTMFPNGSTRKDIAFISKEKGLNLSAMFAILDKKEEVLNKIIMTNIRPTGNVLQE